jgi:hypothetical protein
VHEEYIESTVTRSVCESHRENDGCRVSLPQISDCAHKLDEFALSIELRLPVGDIGNCEIEEWVLVEQVSYNYDEKNCYVGEGGHSL